MMKPPSHGGLLNGPLSRHAPPCPSGRSGHVWGHTWVDTAKPGVHAQRCLHCPTVRHVSDTWRVLGYVVLARPAGDS